MVEEHAKVKISTTISGGLANVESETNSGLCLGVVNHTTEEQSEWQWEQLFLKHTTDVPVAIDKS